MRTVGIQCTCGNTQNPGGQCDGSHLLVNNK
jgi:hypothetical protein